MKVLYITDQFPNPSQSFISREVLGLERLGLQLAILSLSYRNESEPCHAINREIRAPVFYGPDFKASYLRKICYHLHDIGVNPITYLKVMHMSRIQGFPSMQYMFRHLPVYCRLIQTWEAEHLHAHFGRVGALLAWLAGSMLGIPFSVTLHGSDILVDPYPALGILLQHAKLVVCVSNQIRDKVENNYGIQPERVAVIRCGVDTEEYKPSSVTNGRMKILSVARLHPVKGVNDLITACGLLREKGIDFECTIIGEGQERTELQAKINSLGLEGCVNMPGWIENEKLPEIYRSHSLFVLSSYSEGLPVVIMEAMACGLPVVATRVGGVPEIVEHGRNGAIVEPHRPDMIADALLNLSNMNDSERKTMAERNREKIQSDFNCHQEVMKLYTFYTGDSNQEQ